MGGGGAVPSVSRLDPVLVFPLPLLEELLGRLRSLGWTLRLHEDVRREGRRMTAYLWTHSDGRWLAGEGETDRAALLQILDAATDELDALEST